MAELTVVCLEAFPKWLSELASDAVAVSRLLTTETTPTETKLYVVGAIGYILRTAELVTDGIEDIAYMEDAFVLRVASSLALLFPGAAAADVHGDLARLAGDRALVEMALESDYTRLVTRVKSIITGNNVLGTNVEAVVCDRCLLERLVFELHKWAQAFRVPGFLREEHTLIKLKSFMCARLP